MAILLLIFKYSAFTFLGLIFVAAIEAFRPLSRLVFKLAENKLVAIKQRSLKHPSPFQSVAESKWIMASENAYVIHDIRPRAPLHYLIIPKKRIDTLLETEDKLLAEMLALAKRLAIEKGFAEEGFRTVINTNPKGLQTVYHLHIHVLAGRQMMLPIG